MTSLEWWTQHIAISEGWAERHWETWQAPHRYTPILALMCYPPPTSLHEIGCGSGANLRLIQSIFPEVQYSGSEPVEAAAQWAETHLRDVAIYRGSASSLTLPTTETILSMYVLAYVDPTDIRGTLEHLVTRCNRLILCEPMQSGGLHTIHYRTYPMNEWTHAYPSLLESFGWMVEWKWPIVPAVDALNTCLVAVKKDAVYA